MVVNERGKRKKGRLQPAPEDSWHGLSDDLI